MNLSGNFKMILTGTPIENHLNELWSLFHFINSDLLGSFIQFTQRFVKPIELEKDNIAKERLKNLIHPFILRRKKNMVVSELPEKIEITRIIELSQKERILYEALRKTALKNIDHMESNHAHKPLKIFAEIMKLRQACCHPNLVAPELNLAGSKLAVFTELLDELLENNHKALIFSQFIKNLKIIRTYLDKQGVSYQYLDGSTPLSERKKQVETFQKGETSLFLISLKAGGTGLNLTAADYVIHMDPWWNPAVEDQASDRVHRIGQSKTVTIYRLVTQHTIEEAIVKLHAHKRDLADALLDESYLSGKMTVNDIIELLKGLSLSS